MRAPFFERMDIFFTTYYGHESYVFLENGLFFAKYERESSNFFVKNHGKRACYCLLWPIEYSSFNRIGFFSINYGHGNRAFFMKKLK